MDSNATKPETNRQDLEKFGIRSSSDIKNILQSILHDEHELYIYYDNDEKHFVTEVLDIIETEDGIKIGLATPFDKHVLRHLGKETRYTIVSFPDGIKIQFEGVGFVEEDVGGVRAYCIDIPTELARLQRREYFRVMIDEQANVHVRLNCGPLHGEFELCDLSIAGCGIRLQGNSDAFKVGMLLPNAELLFNENDTPLSVALTVKNSKPDEENAGHTILGCSLRTPHAPDQARLQRHLLAIERRQRAKQALDF